MSPGPAAAPGTGPAADPQPLPLALVLAGRPTVAIGGGPTSARRVAALHGAGALVRLIAPQLCEELRAAVAAENVTWLPRDYAGPQDLHGAWLVHTATGDRPTDARVARDAAAQRIWCVNAADADRGSAHVPARSVVPTPDGPVTVAVHTGADPRRARTVRNGIERQVRGGHTDLRVHRTRTAGWVALVGAGPGAEDLLTDRARTLLACADVVVTDRLVPAAVLGRLPAEVRIVDVGKAPGHHPVPQEEINALLVGQARLGLGVVRFKGGDPYVLGRGGEERLACERQGVRVEVVPGVSSASAVPAAAGIPLTHRGLARGFTVVSGHEPPPGLPTDRDHTLVLLMAVAGFRRTAARLLRAGHDPDCPVAFVERGFAPDQRVTTAQLAGAGDVAERAGVGAPAVIVLGDVVTVSPHWPPSPGERAEGA